MNEWGIALLSAFAGAIATLVIRETIIYFRRPILKLDFEERKDTNPYILDRLNDESTPGVEERFKFLRLKLKNDGRSPAMNCEARIEITDKDSNIIFKNTLHWARNDPAIYGKDKLDKIYAPIHLNPKDKEELDVFVLEYCNDENGNPTIIPHVKPQFYTMSMRSFPLDSQTNYFVKITVYANNATSKAFQFKVKWDGTLEGFKTAFS